MQQRTFEVNANVFVPQTQQRSFEIGQGQTARARVGKKLGAADRGRAGCQGSRGSSCNIVDVPVLVVLGRVLEWRGSSLMITSDSWIQDSFWLLLPS